LATVDHEPARIDIPFVQRVLDERGPTGAHVTELSWTTEFQVQHRIAKTFRSGQVFLAGDAAHVHSPAGGQGMNLGIQDAVDLAHTLIKALEGTQPGEPHLDG
jgi:2-polyprenyl-6-methoxyphenol hydroxylase-like FAD-dependent oxidoreductase